jgi:hypothetical protein
MDDGPQPACILVSCCAYQPTAFTATINIDDRGKGIMFPYLFRRDIEKIFAAKPARGPIPMATRNPAGGREGGTDLYIGILA